MAWWLGALAAGCASGTWAVGEFEVTLGLQDGGLEVVRSATGDALTGGLLSAGTGTNAAEMQFGSFLFEGDGAVYDAGARWRDPEAVADLLTAELLDAMGEQVARVTFSAPGEGMLAIEVAPQGGRNRVRLAADCDEPDHFLGLGSHAMDVDHAGEAFALWVSEPGIGKVDTDEPPEDWFLTGTRHASSYPVPFLLRPHRPHGILVDTPTRVEVDLCATDPARFSATAWDDQVTTFLVVAGDEPLEVVERLSERTGRIDLPPPWVFAPWNDAIRGSDQVRSITDLLRSAGAPGSVIWTEDWKGATDGATGYHLSGEWELDRTLYPDAEDLALELAAKGYRWWAYFSPFVEQGTAAWDDAVEAGVLIRDADGQPYTFLGATFEETSMVDLTDPAAVDWVQERMQAAIDVGFTGWMADYAEWLPTDAVLSSGADPWRVHNQYPAAWQDVSRRVLEPIEGAFFARSGWTGAQGIAPVVWAGDQRTSFDADDGFPTVVPLGLGASASGVPVFTHDVAGYQSVGNPPSDKELWFRWAALGAFSPVLRTHHGAYDQDNWWFGADEETLAFWVRMATEHMRTWPYRYGLAARAAERGTPMILPVGFVFPEEGETPAAAWGRTDAWMLGPSLLVAPVMEQGATGREVELPAGTSWRRWDTLEPAQSGWFDAPMDEIPVFLAGDAVVPLFETVPDTLVEGGEGLVDLAAADAERHVLVTGRGAVFTEGDGTTYTPSGQVTAEDEVVETLVEGTVEVGGLVLTIEGPVERTYRVTALP